MSRAAPTPTSAPSRKPVNLTIDGQLLGEARVYGTNLSAFLEQALAAELKQLRRYGAFRNRIPLPGRQARRRLPPMSQFTVHRNPNIASQAVYPLLLDVQVDLLGDLATRAVIPMTLVIENHRPASSAHRRPTCRATGRRSSRRSSCW